MQIRLTGSLVLGAILALAWSVFGQQAVKAAPPAPAPESARRGKIVFLGDSLTRGKGLPEAEAFPALIQAELTAAKLPFDVINAGVNGDTSAGGLARVDEVLAGAPDLLVVELGVNDVRRGVDLEQVERNLTDIVKKASERGVQTMLVGLHLPPRFAVDRAHNGGGPPRRPPFAPGVRKRFEAIHPAIAKALSVPLVPCVLHGMAGRPGYHLPDGHPNAAAHQIMAKNVWEVLQPVAQRLAETQLARK